MTLDTIPTGWLLVGLLGQALFTGRFVVQWIASEIRKKSVVPRAFWYFSLAGGVVLLTYAIHRGDLVFMLGQAGGLVVYLRNLILLRKDGRTSVEGGASSA